MGWDEVNEEWEELPVLFLLSNSPQLPVCLFLLFYLSKIAIKIWAVP